MGGQWAANGVGDLATTIHSRSLSNVFKGPIVYDHYVFFIADSLESELIFTLEALG